MRLRTVFGFFIAFPFAALAQQDATAALSGRVVDDSGRAITRASVNYRRVDDLRYDKYQGYTVTSTPINRLVTTSTDGSFSVTGLPAGNYHVCALPSLPTQVGTCEWHRNRGPFPASAGRTVTVPDLVLTAGRTLLIRVLDPNAKLSARAKLLVGVMTEDGYYRRAQPATKSPEAGIAALLSVVIPPNTKCRFVYRLRSRCERLKFAPSAKAPTRCAPYARRAGYGNRSGLAAELMGEVCSL